jgi:Rrf2 family protein
MKITSSIEYATRLMVSLARSHGQRPERAERLASSENVPVDYVNQLLLRLRRAGLVESHRGATGGYSLSREPARITLGQIVRAVDGKVFEDVCEKYGAGEKDCRHQGQCSISPVWKKLGRLISDYFESVTLAGILEQQAAGCVSLDWLEKAPL